MNNYFDIYKKKLNVYGDSVSEKVETEKRIIFEKYLNSSPNRRTVYIDDDYYEIIILTQKQTSSQATFKILVPLNVPIKQGTIIFWKERYWIVDIANVQKEQTYFSGTMNACNNIIRWVDKYGAIHEAHCYIKGNNTGGDLQYKTSSNGFGSNFSFTYASVNGKIQIVIPKNEYTKNIKEEYQFILNNKKWTLVEIDDFSYDGVIGLLLERAIKNPITDDIESGLADANRVGSWSIQVENGYKYSLYKGNEQDLTINVYNNGNIVEINKPKISYKINNKNIISFNDNKIKAIENGKAEIEFYLEESPTIKATVFIEVEDSPVINYYYNFIGNDKIKEGGREYTYTAQRMYNGEEDVNAVFKFEINDIYSLVTIKQIDKNNCIIKTNNRNKFGKIKLTVSDGFKTQEKIISVESLI